MGQEGRAHAPAHPRVQRIGDVDDRDARGARPQRDPQRAPGGVEREVARAGADLHAGDDPPASQVDDDELAAGPVADEGVAPSGAIAV